ncbi:MAG: type secretion system protein VasD [Acetobacteraceae bacterium]|jgi:type VI secretion system protein VasD|nr:type secretion system protein VasD [Acetobacteraceae bacterium]
MNAARQPVTIEKCRSRILGNYRPIRVWPAILFVSMLLARCSSAPPPPPPPPPKPPPVVTIVLTGSADQNPDVNGAASPVAVRIIELTGTNKFERADVYALIDHEQQTLGPDEAASQELILSPSQQRSITIDPKPGVTAIGVAALFRDIDNAQWRAVAPIASNGATRLAAGIGKGSVTLKQSP